MKRITQSIVVLILVSMSLFTACGPRSSAAGTIPNADHLVTFNAEGVATLQGYLSNGHETPASNGRPNIFISIDVPVKVDGIKCALRVPMEMLYETTIASNTVNQTSLKEYLIFNPGGSMSQVYSAAAMVEVTFRKNGTAFEALSVREVAKKSQFFQKWGVIDGFFQKDASGRPVVGGSISQAHKDKDGAVMYWVLSAAIPVHAVRGDVVIWVESTPETKIVTSQGTFDRTTNFKWSLVQIVYSKKSGKMIAEEITALP